MEQRESEPLIQDDATEEVEVKRRHVQKQEPKRRWLTVEPIILLYYIYYGPCYLVADQYVFHVLSQKYNSSTTFNYSVCDNNNNNNESMGNISLQEKIQSESSQIMLILNAVGSLTAMVSVSFLGAYSDDGGRKVVMGLPIIGSMIKCICFVLVISLELHYWYLIIGVFVEGLCGSILTCLMGCFAYIADISSVSDRTLRVTLLEVCVGISTALSRFMSGYLIDSIGYRYTFIILLATNLLNLAYIIVLIPETRPRINTKLFELKHFKKTVHLYLNDDGTKRRWKLQLSLLTLIFGILRGYDDVTTFYLKGKPLCFSAVQIGYYTGGVALALNSGSLFAVKCFEKVFGNVGLIILSTFSGAISSVLLGFTKHIWMLALVVVTGVFSYLAVPMIRSLVSKLVQPHEQGAVFASIAFAQAATSLIGAASFTSIYSASLHVYASLVYFVIAAFYFIGFILSCLQLYLTKRERLSRDNKGEIN